MMKIAVLTLIALGLSFDTFAVSISTGLIIRHIRFWQGFRIAIVLAFFQSVMPFFGWLGGIQVEKYLYDYDHWIAFGLLSAIGFKMIIDSFKDSPDKKFNPLWFPVLISMAIATSIDALVVGITLAFIDTSIYLALIIIGSVTFLVSMVGMLLGKNITGKFGKKVEIVGGLILIGIGTKILMNHLL
ncbi:MAG: manganese efflux pump MntP family protein [Calditrichia bacterium]